MNSKAFYCVRRYILAWFFILITIGIYSFFALNVIMVSIVDFDANYNATVAANLFKEHEYIVSYPWHIPFYHMITTGPTVIIPTAVLYRLFGINSITNSIVSLMYGCAGIFCLWLLFAKCLSLHEKRPYLFSAFLTAGIVITDIHYFSLSTRLLGESAGFFFIMVSLNMIYEYLRTRKILWAVIAGVALAFSFLTKSSLIFVLVSVAFLFVFEVICKKFYSGIVSFLGGMAIGAFLLEIYKYYVLGSLSEYILWWKDEWDNMLNQSSGIDLTYGIRHKTIYLKEIFGYRSVILCLLVLFLPVLLYFIRLCVIFIHSIIVKTFLESPGCLTMLICGLSGASLMVYFLLFGGRGLAYARRHAVNEMLVRIFGFYLLSVAIFYVYDYISNQKTKLSKQILVSVVIILSICIFEIYQFTISLYRFKNSYISNINNNIYLSGIMKEYLEDIAELPSDAMLFCYGWWQEPCVTLYCDREMYDIKALENGSVHFSEENYFLVGQAINDVDVDKIENALGRKIRKVNRELVDYSESSALMVGD